MTTVTLSLNDSGSIVGFFSKGHAGFGQSGRDIVCAGISAILQTAALGLTQVASLSAGVEIDEQRGEMTLLLERDLSEEGRRAADIILNTMRLGLLSLREAYPRNLKIVERRCK